MKTRVSLKYFVNDWRFSQYAINFKIQVINWSITKEQLENIRKL